MPETADERQARRRAWFRLGEHGVRCVLEPEPPPGYVCPICLRLFKETALETGDLTDEHVPPKSVGGNVLVLTCRACNAYAGAWFDPAVAADERLRTFGSSHTTGPLRATVTVGRTKATGRISFDGSNWVMTPDPGQNNPTQLAAHEQALASLGPNETLTFSIPRCRNPSAAALGWTRAAYLAAFALHGYRHILQPALDPLRQALTDPDSTFEPLMLTSRINEALDPLLAKVTGPAGWAGCWAGVFGTAVVILPPWGAPATWWETQREGFVTIEPSELRLQPVTPSVRFPVRPMHLTDG